MVSETLRNLASRLAGWADTGGVYLDAPACRILSDTLVGAAEDVSGFEGLPVPPQARPAPALPAGVVNLAAERHARTLRAAGGDWGAR